MTPPSSDDLLIARLMDLPAAERSAFWQRMCAEHPGLRERSPEVTRLLAANGSAAPLPATSLPLSADVMVNALESALDPADREVVGTRIGPYKLIQKIGEGGFGAVWMADQQEPLRRRVALKIIKIGMDTEEVIARFEVERQALALMDHPNIARVFDAGATASGRPFFVMELVRGMPITHYCDENRLTAAARLNLFIAVCSAVQHAHQKGVIHRDIKPSNILVTLHDGTPVPKIIDFGIAKATDRKLTEKTLVTQFHAFVGTPVYTSPEQMEMSGLDVDTRSDIYSLGVLLYELLAGRPPFDATALLKSGLDAMRRTIREVDPPRPSNRLNTLSDADRTSVAHQRGTDAAKLRLLLRGDVDWIVMHCLEKDRTRRYDTATALATDIQHHLRHEPVVARPPSEAYRLRMFIRRHRVGFAASAALVLSLLGGLVASSTLFVRERAAHERAVVAEQAENRLRHQAEAARTAEAKRASRTSQALAEQLFQDGKTSEALAHLVRAAKSDPENYVVGPRLMSALAYRSFALPAGEPITEVDGAGYTKDGQRIWIYRASGTPAATLILLGGRQSGRFWRYGADGGVHVHNLADGRLLHSFKVEAGGAGADSPDGRRFAVGRADGSVIVLDAATGRVELGPLRHGSSLNDIIMSPDGRWLGTAGTDRTAKIWDVTTGELRATLPHARGVEVMNFSPDSRRVVTATGSNGHWRVWSVPEGEAISPPKQARNQTSFSVFSPDGSLVVVTDNEGAQVFQAASNFRAGQELNHGAPCYYAEFSPDGSLLATTSNDATARLWKMPSGKLLFSLAHGAGVGQARFTPDGRHLLTRSSDGTVRVWDVRTGRLAQEPIGTGYVVRIDLTPDGSEFFTYSRDRTARRWRMAPGAIQPLRLSADPDRLRIRIDPDTVDTAWVLYRQRMQQLDLLSGRNVGAPRPLPVPISNGVLARGAEFAFVNVGGTNREIWDLRRPEIVRRHIGQFALSSSLFSPDSSRIAASDSARNLRVWDTKSGSLVLGPIANGGRYFDFSPDGRQLIAGTQGNTATLWDLTSGKSIGEPLRHEVTIQPVRFSPDGRLIATGAQDGTVRWWDAKTTQPMGQVLAHRSLVRSVEFTHDSRRLISCDPLEARLWDVTTGAPLGQPLVGGNDLASASFTADDKLVATLGRSAGDVHVWDALSGQLHSEPIRANFRLAEESSQFLSAGRFVIISRVYAGEPWLIWPVPLPANRQLVPGWLLRLATAVAGGEIDANAAFRERTFDPKAFDEVRRELAALPADSPLADWGRWFLADRASRPIGPGFKVTAEEAEALASDTSGGELLALDRRANALERTGQFAEEAKVVRQGLELARKRYGVESRESAAWSAYLAWVLIQAKQPAEAEPAARAAIAIREKLPDADTPDLALARQRLGWALIEQARQTEAEPVLLAAYEAYRRFQARASLSAGQRGSMSWTAQLLARLYDATQQPAKAAEWKQKAAPPPAPKP